MLCQDVPPLYAPVHHNIHRPSSYVVPTDRKRQALCWEIRHQLANYKAHCHLQSLIIRLYIDFECDFSCGCGT